MARLSSGESASRHRGILMSWLVALVGLPSLAMVPYMMLGIEGQGSWVLGVLLISPVVA